jgi:hypothetical protein
MKTRMFAITILSAMFAGSAGAAPEDDTVSGSSASGSPGVSAVNVGNSQYASIWFKGGFTCGTNYSSTGVRLSPVHPRYQDMLKVLLASQLTGNYVWFRYQSISGVCWLKNIGMDI